MSVCSDRLKGTLKSLMRYNNHPPCLQIISLSFMAHIIYIIYEQQGQGKGRLRNIIVIRVVFVANKKN